MNDRLRSRSTRREEADDAMASPGDGGRFCVYCHSTAPHLVAAGPHSAAPEMDDVYRVVPGKGG